MKFELLINILKKKEVKGEEKEIIDSIIDAQEELELAEMYFNNEEEPELLEYAIYRECAARAKYKFYINKLKRLEEKNKNTTEAV